MIALESAELIYQAAKNYRDSIKDYNKKLEKYGTPAFAIIDPRKALKHEGILIDAARARSQAQIDLHTIVVQCGICDPWPDDQYTPLTFYGSGSYTFALPRLHPLKAHHIDKRIALKGAFNVIPQ